MKPPPISNLTPYCVIKVNKAKELCHKFFILFYVASNYVILTTSYHTFQCNSIKNNNILHNSKER